MGSRSESSNDHEFNFDGWIGPSHNYAGLSTGNVASAKNRHQISHPKQAALQGLSKMMLLQKRGFGQGLLPPHPRPDFEFLRDQGYDTRNEKKLVDKLAKQAPHLLATAYSASSMWTANAGTHTPSIDAKDSRFHFTPANLDCMPHRSIEAAFNFELFQTIFSDEDHFKIHPPTIAKLFGGDEGAANHTRLTCSHSSPGLHLFVYGVDAEDSEKLSPLNYPARQSLQSFQEIEKHHQLQKERCFYLQQNPEVIDAGVFHNNGIAVGNLDTYFYHEKAYLNSDKILDQLTQTFEKEYHQSIHFLVVKENEVSIADAISSYLFNSQLVSTDNGKQIMFAPQDCSENESVRHYLERISEEKKIISEVVFFDLKESMKNGGGPACLRQRLVLSDDEFKLINENLFLKNNTAERMKGCINKYYRDDLSPSDLADFSLVDECRRTTEEIYRILKLDSLIRF